MDLLRHRQRRRANLDRKHAQHGKRNEGPPPPGRRGGGAGAAPPSHRQEEFQPAPVVFPYDDGVAIDNRFDDHTSVVKGIPAVSSWLRRLALAVDVAESSAKSEFSSFVPAARAAPRGAQRPPDICRHAAPTLSEPPC